MKREKLIEYRGERSQAEMGKIYNISQQLWSSWENGLTMPSPAIMKRLEDDSGTPMEELFFDKFNQESLSNTQAATP